MSPIWVPPQPDRKFVTEHRVTVADLFPNATRYYYVVSTTADGKTSRGPEVPQARGPRVVPLSFRTLAPDSNGPPDFAIKMDGPTRVYAGSDLYVGVRTFLLSGSRANLYDLGATVEGPAPQSIDTAYFCQTRIAASGRDEYGRMFDPQQRPFCWSGNNNSASMLRLRTSPNTKPGDYVVHLRLKASDVVDDAS